MADNGDDSERIGLKERIDSKSRLPWCITKMTSGCDYSETRGRRGGQAM